MVRQKVTITLDRSKADTARALMGAGSTSKVIDAALDSLIRSERLRRDVAAYRAIPPTESEMQLGLLGEGAGLADETDWEALYALEEG